MSAQAAEPKGIRPRLVLVPTVRRPTSLEPIANRWQRALDADYRALNAVKSVLPPAAVGARSSELARERHETELLLARLARTTGALPAPWLADAPLTTNSLGLEDGVEACLFDLDGVLTDSGVLHAWAWALTFDPLLQQLAEQADWQFVPFDRQSDYRAYVDGRPRLEGVHAFLASRGIQLPEGRPTDPAEARTAYGLARRKSDLLGRELYARGVMPLEGARRYLQAAGRAGLGRAVISASTRTLPMLELADLDALIDERVDADLMQASGLHPRPAPDLLLAACRRLGVPPGAAVTMTHSAAGVAAAAAAGIRVVGIADGDQAEVLHGFGAERVVGSLRQLLDRRLQSTS